MHPTHNDEQLCRPEMQVADQRAEWDEIRNGLNGEGGLIRCRNVIEQFQDTRASEHQNKEDRGSTHAQGIAPTGLSGRDGGWVEVVEEGGSHGEGSKKPPLFQERFQCDEHS